VSNLQRILNMASKALNTSGQSAPTSAGKTDWRDLVRTAADKVTGDSRPAAAPQQAPTSPRPNAAAASVRPEDAAAIARYDYLLKTARPDQLEQVHLDAFARLTPAQRQQVNAQLTEQLPAAERPVSAEPADLARAAARGEAHNPGFLRGLFAKASGGASGRGAAGLAGAGAGTGVGLLAGAGLGAAGGLLAAVAGGAVLSSVAAPILEQAAGLGVDFENLAGGLGDLSAGAEDYAGGIGEQLTEAGSNIEVPQLSDLGSNFEIPGLGDLGRFFGRD
jgi:hypothetical protein